LLPDKRFNFAQLCLSALLVTYSSTVFSLFLYLVLSLFITSASYFSTATWGSAIVVAKQNVTGDNNRHLGTDKY
jgi:hypothetical protein